MFFDYDRIEMLDEENSVTEDRYDTIGDVSAGAHLMSRSNVIGTVKGKQSVILFVVYTERVEISESEQREDITRLISARMATGFGRELYFGKYE